MGIKKINWQTTSPVQTRWLIQKVRPNALSTVHLLNTQTCLNRFPVPDGELIHRNRSIRLGLFLGLLPILAACGRVITVTPTPDATPLPVVEIVGAALSETATSTPAPYTPEPTHTPTNTPTPIVHLIQPGESLLAIADRYGVSVAALQDANGILDPRSLQIGQQLIVPRLEEEEETEQAGSGTPTPTPDVRVRFENLYLSTTNIGGLAIFGEVFNGSESAVEQVKVGVTLLNNNNQLLANGEENASLDLLDAGKRAPVVVLFEQIPTNFDNFQAVVLHAIPAYVGSYYRDLETHNVAIQRKGYNSYAVTGVIANIGPEEANAVYVVLTAYDSLSRVVATRKIEPEANILPPGSHVSFDAALAPLGGPIVRVEAVAQGKRKR